jgi:hypothetical protein
MRLIHRRMAVVGVLGAASALWAGCSGAKATEVVAGISSQVQVPRDMHSVYVYVQNPAGAAVYCQAFPVYENSSGQNVVRLPRTLGIVNGGDPPGAAFTVTVAGFGNDATDPNVGAFTSCLPPQVGLKSGDLSTGGGGRILRRTKTTYQSNRILFLPMPLHYACYDVDCHQQQGCEDDHCTCRGGKCVDATIDSATLPDYDPSLIIGTANTCFRPLKDPQSGLPGCLDFALTPQTVDAQNCIYALPGSPSVPSTAPPYDPTIPSQLITLAQTDEGTNTISTSNLNVRVMYDNQVSEVLDYEGPCPAPGQSGGPVEGYCTFADAPQKFQIADGVCHNPLHKITSMSASAGCVSKTEYQPICQTAEDVGPGALPDLPDGGNSTDGGCNVATQLTPAPSALYLLFDKGSGMKDFFGQKALSQVMSLSLSDPAFAQTSVAFMYTPNSSNPQADCTAAPDQNFFATPSVAKGGIPFEASATAQADIGTNLLNQALPDGGVNGLVPETDPWYLQAALSGAYTALTTQSKTKAEAFNRLAVMLFFDRDVQNDCGGTAASAATESLLAYQSPQQIETYVVYLGNANDQNTTPPGLPPAQWIADANAIAQPSTAWFDATGENGDPATVQVQALTHVIADLGSCVYEVPSNISSGAALSFFDVVASPPTNVTVKYGASCDGEDAVNNPLWVFDNQHIHMCPQTCKRLVNSAQTDRQIVLAQNIQNAQNGLPPNVGLPPGLPLDITVTALEQCDPPQPDPKVVEAGVDSAALIDAAPASADAAKE